VGGVVKYLVLTTLTPVPAGNAEYEEGKCGGKRVGSPAAVGLLKTRAAAGTEDGIISIYGGRLFSCHLAHLYESLLVVIFQLGLEDMSNSN
jgi:hypothetical protein